jgi:Tol biopolymer transport system component
VEAADGLIFRQIMEGEGADIWGGSPSPDGRYFVYSDWDNANGDLAIRDLETGEVRRLTNDSGTSDDNDYAQEGIFSPDGRQIAYSWYTEDGVYELHLMNVDGTGQRSLHESGDQWSARLCDWSPDGNHILVYRHLGWLPRESQIALVSLRDGSHRLLKELDWRVPMNVSLAPDGRHVVYDFPAGEHPSNHDVFLLTVNDREVKSLISHPANDFVLGWVPGSRSILFASDRTGHWGMWMVSVDQNGQALGPARLIKKDTGLVRPLGFTRDGSFYYGIGRDQIDVFTAELELESGAVLSAPAPAIQEFMGSNQSPAWSPDGRYLAYTSGQSRVPQSMLLCIRSEETGKIRKLSPSLTGFRGLQWSPDGRSILTIGTDPEGRRGAFLIDVQSGEVIDDLIRPGLPFPPEWASDSKGIIFADKDFDKTRSQIVWRDLATGQEKKIGPMTEGSILNRVRVSPDGSQLAARHWRPNNQPIELVVLSVNGGELRTLLSVEDPNGLMDLAWAPDGKQLLYFKGVGELPHNGELWAISVEGGEPRYLGISTGYVRQLSVHPDGKQIVFAGSSRDDEPQVWVMEGFLDKFAASK